jgi:predicted ATPase
VTRSGLGGIGKTRLALRFAWVWRGDYPGGTWFCDLASARSVDGIVHAVARGLNVPLGRADPVQQLGAAISGRGECLVVLDNFEQVAAHAEATLGTWLERAPLARFVVTSRELLGIAGEQVLALGPLPRDDAVTMFRIRARAAGGAAAFDAVDEAALSPLVDLLDGFPLAIELAAARTRLLRPLALLQRMSDRFKLLVSRSGRIDSFAVTSLFPAKKISA